MYKVIEKHLQKTKRPVHIILMHKNYHKKFAWYKKLPGSFGKNTYIYPEYKDLLRILKKNHCTSNPTIMFYA